MSERKGQEDTGTIIADLSENAIVTIEVDEESYIDQIIDTVRNFKDENGQRFFIE